MKWLIIERLKPPHHPRQCYVMACTDRHDGMFLGITVWETDSPQHTVGVGIATSGGNPRRYTQPVVGFPGWAFPNHAARPERVAQFDEPLPYRERALCLRLMGFAKKHCLCPVCLP